MPDRDAHRRSLVSEALHEAPTEEAGAPKHADQFRPAARALASSTPFHAASHDLLGSLLQVSVCIDNFVEYATRDCFRGASDKLDKPWLGMRLDNDHTAF
ncbi:MAG TPA: hypothetical protein VGR65_07095 [Casimicrobiaceae bacterium]|nr:hypothetical protein [Casimicrobiaceae bacterium]